MTLNRERADLLEVFVATGAAMLRFVESSSPLRFVLLDVRGRGNPIPVLKALCKPKGWCIAEMGEDGEYLNFATAEKKWDEWQRYLSAAIEDQDDA